MANAIINVIDNNNIVPVYPATTIERVTGLQTTLDGKAAANHTHSTFSTTSAGFVPAASASGDTDKYLKGDGTWETPSGGGGAVSGVKGNAESTYRTGNVNLTCDNIGASPNDHSHGSIGRNGDISNDVTIANNDKLLIKDYSDSNRVKTSSISFDGSTTTQFLSKKGTWETPSGGGVTGVKGSNESSYRTGNVSLSYSNVGAASSSHTHSAATTSSNGFMSYTDKSIIGHVPWEHISTTFSASSANAWQYSGLSFSVPGGTLYEFIIMNKGTGSGATPLGIIVGDISTGFDTSGARFIIAENSFTSAKSNDNVWVRSLHGMTPVGYTSGSKTWYVWVKNKTTGTHAIDVFYRPIYY